MTRAGWLHRMLVAYSDGGQSPKRCVGLDIHYCRVMGSLVAAILGYNSLGGEYG